MRIIAGMLLLPPGKPRARSDPKEVTADQNPQHPPAFKEFFPCIYGLLWYNKSQLILETDDREAGSHSHPRCRFHIPSSHRYGPAVLGHDPYPGGVQAVSTVIR
jgi:hypothetical protein